jgi:hypothetical protein
MSDHDGVEKTGSIAGPCLEAGGGADAPNWPNPVVVLEVLAALEEEFRAVLSPNGRGVG